MSLLINDETIAQNSYTCKDILNEKYHDLYVQAEECCKNLHDWQTNAIALMPDAKQLLPQPCNIKGVEELYNANEQTRIQSYVFLLSLFGFCNKVYSDVRVLCDTLAHAINNDDTLTESMTHSNLNSALHKLSILNNIFSPTLTKNSGITGMLRLLDMTNYLGIHSFAAVGSYSFRDIIGTIAGQGYYDLGILIEAINAPMPTAPTVAEAADDDKLIRML